MKIKPFVFGVVVLVVFLGIIAAFQAAGFWTTSGKTTAGGQKVAPVAGDVNTIKGWMTLKDISTTFNVPVEEILAQFQLPADTPATTAVKELETDLFSVTNLRAWLQARMDGGGTPAGTPVP
ncbi:MAG: hypothetical protein HGA86_08675 [Anaerolineaceae bacterium]|nr:hypothetical protein [Anaerolineaceae bacterium]